VRCDKLRMSCRTPGCGDLQCSVRLRVLRAAQQQCRAVMRMQAERYQLGLRRFDFDAGLAPYPQHSHGQWQQLSGHITQARPTLPTCLWCLCLRILQLPVDVVMSSVAAERLRPAHGNMHANAGSNVAAATDLGLC
jgi:AAR2 protein